MKNKAQLGLCALLAAITLLVYLPVRQHQFLLFDDADYVTDNHVVQSGLTWAGVKWAFTTFHSSNWHPITWLSHMLDVQLFGPGPAGPHVVNVLIHVANTILLFVLLRRFTGALWRSALVAALFALHPLHVESVAWVAERKDVLSAFFGLLALLAYRSYTTHRSYGTYMASLVLFALGLMSKPMLVTLPFVLLLLDYWPLKRVPGVAGEPAARVHVSRFTFQSLVWEKIPFFALSVLSCLMTVAAQKQAGAVRSLASFPLSERIANALVACGQYLAKTFWPDDLAIFYPHPGHWPAGQVVLAAGVIVALCTAAFWFRRKAPFVATGWFWFCGMLIPVIGLVQVSNQSMADRYTYLPLIGIFVVLAWGLGEALVRWRMSKVVAGIAGGLVLIACAARTMDQLRYWRDGETLFRHALAVTKDNFVAHNNLGSALLERGELDAAIDQFRAALKLRPDYADAACNLGVALLRKGSRDEAIAWFRKTLELQPDHALAGSNLAIAYLQNRQMNEALTQFQKTLVLQPNDVLIRINYGNALLQAGQTDAAIASYREALKIQPDHADAHNNLGIALLRTGGSDEAMNHFQRALSIRPNHANAHNNLAEMFLGRGELDQAIDHYQKSLAIEPNNAEAHNNLANALLQQGRVEEAARHLRTALEIRPDFAEAHNNLGYVLVQTGQVREAVVQYELALKQQPDNTHTLASLAWVLATCSEASVRNANRAIELAERARQSGGETPMVLHSLAAAYAEAGRFADATAAAQRALQLAEAQSNAMLSEMLREEIKIYQSGSPFREGRR